MATDQPVAAYPPLRHDPTGHTSNPSARRGGVDFDRKPLARVFIVSNAIPAMGTMHGRFSLTS
jgi:hypothetical protein